MGARDRVSNIPLASLRSLERKEARERGRRGERGSVEGTEPGDCTQGPGDCQLTALDMSVCNVLLVLTMKPRASGPRNGLKWQEYHSQAGGTLVTSDESLILPALGELFNLSEPWLLYLQSRDTKIHLLRLGKIQ